MSRSGSAAEAPVARVVAARAGRIVPAMSWALRFTLALFLFVGALQLMKTGAANLSVLQHDGFLVRNAGSTFGLGWIGALFVLSGSPIAASALALVAGGSISETEGFTMLTGSRLGAAFVVLVVAVIYALKGGYGQRLKPVSTAVIALAGTALIYLPAAVVGFALLNWAPFRSLDVRFPAQFGDIIDVVYGGLIARVESLPAGVLFLGGLGVLLASFKLIDTVLPQLDDSTVTSSKLSWLRKVWPMFALGAAVALVTMSVSVALTVLVPLVAKGYARREDILPYILGANITTLGDTLLAAFALNSPAAVRIVVAGVVATTLFSVLVLAFLYPQVRRVVWRFQRQVIRSKIRLAAFTAALFVTPLLVMSVAALIG